jgi:hypothetical protein
MRYINFYTISILFILSSLYLISPFLNKIKLNQKIYLSLVLLTGVITIKHFFNNYENFESKSAGNNALLNAYKTLTNTNNIKIFTPNNKPIVLNKNNDKDYKALVLSNIGNNVSNPDSIADIKFGEDEGIKLKNQSFNAIIYPQNTEDFFIPEEDGFFDIGNANTNKYITGDVGALNMIQNNYTMEIWLKPQFFGNPYIISFNDGVKRTIKKELNQKLVDVPMQYFSLLIDENNIYIENDSIENFVPYTPGEWIQLVIKRGENDEIGSDFGKIYKNGIYLRNTNNAKNLSGVKEWIFFQNPAKLGLTHNQYLSSNPLYNNRSCFSIFRLYNKALDDAEILQNYNFNAYKYNITSIPGLPYIKDSLICNLDTTDRNSYPGVGFIWHDISPVEPMNNTQLPNPSLIINPGDKSLSELLPKNNKIKKCNRNIKSHLNKQNLDISKVSALVKIDEKIDIPKLTEIPEESIEIPEENQVLEEENQQMEEITNNISINKNNIDLSSQNIGQILNSDKKTIGIIDGNKKIQMLEAPINKLNGIPVVGYLNKSQNQEDIIDNNSWLNF